MQKYPNEEKKYYKVRDEIAQETSLDVASRFYYLRKTCYRGMLRYNKKGKFNIPYGRYKTCNCELLKNKDYEILLKNTEDGGKMVCNMDMASNSVCENRNGLQENGKEEEG